jgi:hypothetical protein
MMALCRAHSELLLFFFSFHSFDDVLLTVSRTAREHEYEIRVDTFTKAANVFQFDVSASLALQRLGATSVAWRDAERHQFVFSMRVDAARERDMLVHCLSQCIFERETGRSPVSATPADLSRYVTDLFQSSSSQSSSTSSPSSASVVLPSSRRMILPPPPISPCASAKLVGEFHADLYCYDDKSAAYIVVENDVRVSLSVRAKFAHELSIVGAGNKLVWAQALSIDMHHHYSSVQSAFTWLFVDGDSTMLTLSLRFDRIDGAAGATFRDAFAQCLWESKQQKSFASVDEDERQWILDADRDVVTDMQTDDGLTDDDVSEFEGSLDEDDNDAAPRDSALSTNADDGDDERNSLLAVGQAHNRSFVVRGSHVGVFKQTHDDDLEFVHTLSPLRSARGTALTPSRAMLHARDTSLLLTDSTDPQRLYRLDLERGDVVEAWESSSNVREVLPEKKGAQATDSPVLLGMNSKAFFALDTRQAGDKCVASRTFQYAGRSPQLSCAATTGAGQIVLGTENGDVRLFSAKRSLLSTPDAESRKPRASTNLPGFGDAVTAVDATEDGQWVLATCKTYLMCICTSINGTTGFEARMGAQKPAPRRLQLSPADVRRVGGAVSFTPARFNTGPMGEQSIVTSTGPWVITWSFRKVKQNVLNVYQMREFADDVVQDHFARGTDRKVVVALPNNVLLASKTAGTPKKK